MTDDDVQPTRPDASVEEKFDFLYGDLLLLAISALVLLALVFAVVYLPPG